ncbi:MAG: FAD-binding oxidoreductase [Syntrophales bacterium]|jgi:ferredoxin-NADP reductase|nr:FAD-binding oxidoreductase [Syntrophales bacterium]MDY0043967.1 FAD-binding oxidoreductase [Syntrophales bacterium]
MNRDFRTEIEGYREIEKELSVLQKYAIQNIRPQELVTRITDRFHPKRIKMRVSEIREETPDARTLRFVPAEGYLPPFHAGQYINVYITAKGIRTARPYSISSSPFQTAYYEITIKRVTGGFVSSYLLDTVNPGDDLETSGPEGHFYYNPLFHGNDLVFIAGGSGITPFMSMIREVTDRGHDRTIHLIYGNRSPDNIIFDAELKERAQRHTNLTVANIISEPPKGYDGYCGLITSELIQKIAGDISGKMFYLCGSEEMNRFCREEFAKLNIQAKHIRSDSFGLPGDITLEPDWPASVRKNESFIVMLNGGVSLTAFAGEPLINALERAGITVPNSCRTGECSLCRIRLVSGEVFQPAGVKVRKSDRRFGYIHACASYPLTDLKIMI